MEVVLWVKVLNKAYIREKDGFVCWIYGCGEKCDELGKVVKGH